MTLFFNTSLNNQFESSKKLNITEENLNKNELNKVNSEINTENKKKFLSFNYEKQKIENLPNSFTQSVHADICFTNESSTEIITTNNITSKNLSNDFCNSENYQKMKTKRLERTFNNGFYFKIYIK